MDNLVSIVVPVYNVAECLDHCIQSLVTQTYNNIEILLINDGSTDQTGDICDMYAEKDSRIKVIHKSNGGVSSARNMGIENAKGQFIVFVDGDDWLNFNAVELLLNRILETKADICFCNSYYKDEDTVCIATTFDTDSVVPALDIARRHLHYGFVASSCLSISRLPLSDSPTIGDHPKFTEKIHTLEDWEYNFRLILSAKEISILSTPYYHYRTNEGSASKSPLNKRKMSCFLIPHSVEKFVSKHNLPLSEDVKFVPIFLLYHMLVIYSGNGYVEKTISKLRKIAIQNLGYALKSPNVALRYKIYVLMAAIHPILFKVLYNLKNRKFI